jgi:tetratricopeptide (TPR) repeat protein
LDEIGTVTKYYAFVEPSIKETLESIMKDAQDYHDFIVRLSHELANPDSPEPLAHIGAVLSCDAQNIETNNRIANIHEHRLSVKPWIIQIDSSQKLDAVNDLIDSSPPDWILFQAYLRKAERLYLVPQAYDSLEEAKKVINSNKEMDCFEPVFIFHKVMLQRVEEYGESASQLGEVGLKKARDYNDIQLEVDLLIQQASYLMNSDIHRAFENTQSAYTLARKLGTPNLITSTVIAFGTLSTIIGEYDAALHAYAEGVEILQSLGAPLCHIPIHMSEVYSDIEEGRSALEWAKEALNLEASKNGQGGLDDHLCPHISMARALSISGKLEEALEYVNKSHEISLRSGQEGMLATYYYTHGVYDIASGDFLSGVDLLTRALEICDRITRSQRLINRCLLALTKAEIELFETQDQKETDPDDSGPWMTRLGQEARKKGFPGIQLQHALLKAEFQEKIGLSDVAMETLDLALSSASSPGTKSLQQQINDKIENLKEQPISP